MFSLFFTEHAQFDASICSPRRWSSRNTVGYFSSTATIQRWNAKAAPADHSFRGKELSPASSPFPGKVFQHSTAQHSTPYSLTGNSSTTQHHHYPPPAWDVTITTSPLPLVTLPEWRADGQNSVALACTAAEPVRHGREKGCRGPSCQAPRLPDLSGL